MWTRYRIWKHLLGTPLIVAALILMKGTAEFSPLWYGGMVIALCLGAAYVVEEIVWMSRRRGRPCGHCDQMVQMKSFSIVSTCPHCGLPFE
jgi:hypothetical protein